jgi:hypothetical protein
MAWRRNTKAGQKRNEMLTIHGQHHTKQTLIVYTLPEERKEEDRCRQKESR